MEDVDEDSDVLPPVLSKPSKVALFHTVTIDTNCISEGRKDNKSDLSILSLFTGLLTFC